MGKRLEKILLQTDTRMPEHHVKRFSASLTSRDMYIKTTGRKQAHTQLNGHSITTCGAQGQQDGEQLGPVTGGMGPVGQPL